MTLDDLSSFEWHDLPVSRFCIAEWGVELVVMPYNETAVGYDRFRLTLRDASWVRLDVRGEVSLRDWSGFEVSRFDFRAAGERRLSGELCILPGSAGFGTIRFEGARWELERLPADEAEPAG